MTIIRSSFKLCSTSSLFRKPVQLENVKQRLCSTFLTTTGPKSTSVDTRIFKSSSSPYCSKYTISSHQFSTQNETKNQFVEYLNEAIQTEESFELGKKLPSKIDDFQIKLDGSSVSLTKSLPGETITVSFNVNHSEVESNYEPPEQIEEGQNNEDTLPELVSRFGFGVDIKRGRSILGFSCGFVYDEENMVSNNEQEQVQEPRDIFGIDEIVFYKGDLKDNDYRVSTDTLDPNLYQIFMDFLDEKGVSNEFMRKVSTFCTDYLASLHVNFLKNVQKFEVNHRKKYKK